MDTVNRVARTVEGIDDLVRCSPAAMSECPVLAPLGKRLRRLAGALALVAALLALGAAGASAAAPQLKRYPYLSDATSGGVTVNWGTDRTLTTGTLRWGRVGVESCTANAVTATRASVTVGSVSEYQWTARAGTGDGTRFCYRVFGGTVDLLGADASPQADSRLTSTSTPFKFAVLGDWGQGYAAGNPGQAGVMRQIAGSGARFAVGTGDIGYPSGNQTNYGDLFQTGDNVSGVFAPDSWTLPGRSIPHFPTNANHGRNGTFLQMWPSAQTAAAAGGRFQMDTYCCTNGTSSASYPSVWYAFDQGGARFYVLDASWADTNNGTATIYENDYDNHWTPASPEYQWLQRDLANHPGSLKLAFWHYPLYVDNSTQTSDTFLQGPTSLEGLLHNYGVSMAFSGHAHVYERNLAPAGGFVSYVTGGGGGRPQPVSHCSAIDAYAIGWSTSSGSGSKCGAGVKPTSALQFHHFLLVTVNGRQVTVTPTDSQGRTFDVQTYDFSAPPPPPPADTTAPTAPGNVTAAAASSSRVDVNWTASTDNVGVTGYNITRNGVLVATVSSATSWSDTTVAPGTTYTYAVSAFDAARNASSATAAAPVTTPTGGSLGIRFVRQATGSTGGGTSFDVPIVSTSGDALVAAVAIQAGSTAAVTGVTDSAGGTWTKGAVGFLSGSSTRTELWYRTAAPSVTNATVTLSTAKAAGATVAEFSGVATAGALDVAAGNTGTASSTTAPTPTITTTLPGDVVVGSINYPGSATSSLVDGAFSTLSDVDVGTMHGRQAYRVAATTGPTSASWKLSAAANSGGAILALKRAP